MTTSIPWLPSAVNYSWIEFWFVRTKHKKALKKCEFSDTDIFVLNYTHTCHVRSRWYTSDFSADRSTFQHWGHRGIEGLTRPRINACQVSVARWRQLASCRRLIQIACQRGAKRWKPLGPIYLPNLLLRATPRLGGHGPKFLAVLLSGCPVSQWMVIGYIEVDFIVFILCIIRN